MRDEAQRRSNSLRSDGLKSDIGATMVEFALVAFTFLVSIFALIDFGTVIYLRSSASGAAQRAVSWMSVQPGLADSSAHAALREEGSRRAKEFLTSSTMIRDLSSSNPPAAAPGERGAAYLLEGAQFIIPAVPSVAEGLKRFPLKARITFGYNPFLMFGLPSKLQFDVFASGYAERLPSETEPMLMDCTGARLTLGELPKKILDPNTKRCVCRNIYQTVGDDCICAPCPKGLEADESSCLCSCPKGMEMVGGSCMDTCGGGRTRDASTSECRCNLTPADCEAPSTLDEANCRCSTQECPPGMVMENNICVCDGTSAARADACNNAGKLWDPIACDCGASCSPTHYVRDNACYSCGNMLSSGKTCYCPEGTDNYVGRGCMCPFSQRDECNQRGLKIDFATCSCSGKCAAPRVAVDDGCACPASMQSDCAARGLPINDSDCSCGEPCQGLQKLSKGKCICWSETRLFCNSIGKVINELCECVNCPEDRVYENGACECAPALRTACNAENRVFDGATCQCGSRCAAGKQASGNECILCPEGARVVGRSCRCPGAQVLKNSVCGCPTAAKRACEALGYEMDPLTCRCSCVGPGCCSKTGEECGARGLVLNSERCRCEGCPRGYVYYSGRCVKPE